MYLLLAVIHWEESSDVRVQGCERRTLSSACPELQDFGETGVSPGNISLQTCVCVLSGEEMLRFFYNPLSVAVSILLRCPPALALSLIVLT